MINLIPNQEKKRKVNDFYFRLVVVFLTMLGFCALVAAASLFPAFFLSLSNKNLANAKLETQKLEPVPVLDQGSLSMMEDTSNKLDMVDLAEKNKYLISQKIVNEIILKKMSDIKITQINYDNSSPGGKKVNVNGVAPSRERLLLFRQTLEDDAFFKKVDLPISNFVKGSNIEFSLSLIPS